MVPPRPAGPPPAGSPPNRGPQRVPRPRAPQPTDEQPTDEQHRDEQRRDEARRLRAAKRAEEHARVPSFGRDLLRAVGLAVFSQVFFGASILLVRWRLLHYKNMEVVDDAHSWAQLIVMVTALMWGFLQMKASRPDLGFRRSGLVPFLLLAVVLVTLVQLIAMSVWPFLIGPDLKHVTVLADVWSDPGAFLIAAGFALCLNAVFTAIVVPMVTCGWKIALVCVLPYLAAILLGGYLATVVLEAAPLLSRALLWSGAGVAGMVLLTVSSVVVLLVRRSAPDVRGARTPVQGAPERPPSEGPGWAPR